MKYYRQYSLPLGLLALILVIVILLSAPSLLFSPAVTFIDSELHHSSGDEVYVRTKLNFSSQEHIATFPLEIEDWKGYDYDTTEVKEMLGADVILLRGYDRPGLYQPIYFTIMQSRTQSSFHPPSVCYAAQVYSVQEEAKENVVVTNTNWMEEPCSSRSIPLARMVVFKEIDDEIIERRVILYCYVKGNQFTSDTITMIQGEALAPLDGSYDSILQVEKDFIALTIPYMFEPAERKEWNPLALRLIEHGAVGYLAIVLVLLVPVAIIVYPRIRDKQDSADKTDYEA